MNKLEFHLKNCGQIRPMHAVNNGPSKAKKTQSMSNFEDYRDAKIPYARLHDTVGWRGMGGPNLVDVSRIFTDFSKDPDDPASYDFFYTDMYIENTLAAGTDIFYGLSETIEHGPKKYAIVPPADPVKWAKICEHIISHYLEGWADGFHYDIKYWEIWNEPDCKDNSMWIGTKQQFFDLYEITAKHLKSRFPQIKIGGPAISQSAFGDLTWAEEFLEYMSMRNVPLDFFSWHIYTNTIDELRRIAKGVEEILVKTGYGEAENIMNEWNYIKGWSEEFIYSVEQIIGVKGAAFIAAVMCTAQIETSIDMAMYYDARPTVFNGMFDYYTSRPLKGYYSIKAFSELYTLGTQVECINSIEDVYSLGAMNNNGDCAFMITRYEDDDNVTDAKAVTVKIPELQNTIFECTIVDDIHTNKIETVKTDENGSLELLMKPNSIFFLKKQAAI